MNKIRTDSARSQSGARTTKFHCKKLSFVQSAKRTMKFHWWWMNVLKRTAPVRRCTKGCALWKNGRGKVYFCLLAWKIYVGTRKQKYRSKTERDVRLLERSLKMKDEHRKIEDIPAAELNGHISEFIIFVRTKDGNEYKPTSLRSLMASFERQLKKKGYSGGIINKALQSKQKRLKKQGKGNKPKASAALTSKS